MVANVTFDELLDAVEHLSPDDQLELISLVQRRLAEQGRLRIVNDVKEARAELEKGALKPASVDDIMREIAS